MKEKRLKNEKRIKKGPRFRVLDAVIILLVITSVVGIYFRYNVFDTLKNQRNLKDYVVSFSIQNIRQSTTSYLDINDVVYDGEDGKKLGELIGYSADSSNPLRPTPASEYFVDQNGNTVQVFYPDSESMDARVDVEGKMLCEGSYSEESGFLVNGSRYLAPGQTIQVQTEKVTLILTVKEIFEADE